MRKGPNLTEWDTSRLPVCRRIYLDSDRSFEQIVGQLVKGAEVCSASIEPYRDAPKETPKGTRQAFFRLRISQQSYDLLYNSPDGLRGRYWQSPDLGAQATQHLIAQLKPKLLEFAKDKKLQINKPADPMCIETIEKSLDAISAKVWVREQDDKGNIKVNSTCGLQLIVHRWEQNESISGSKSVLWRWTPIDDEIEVKGALLDPAGVEHIPESKRDRSCQIYRYGFT